MCAVVESALRALLLCDRDTPILCESISQGTKARAFDGMRAALADGREVQQLMFTGSFGEYCIVSDQQAIRFRRKCR